MAKKYKCPYCNERLIRKDLIDHIDKEHEELIPDGSEAAQVVYDLVNGTKGAGRCRVCGSPTKWNSSAKRYDVLCEKLSCKKKMREDYQKNMLRVHGTYNILNDEEQQKKMLANRSISGTYKFTTDGGFATYTGSYEKKFLEFVDKVMQIPSKDIMAPGPTLEYEMNGEKHFYITDFLYIPYNLIIEVKDGGSNPNSKNSEGMRSSRQRTIEKEKLITDRGEFNYLRLTDNQFVQLLEIFMEIKKALLEGNDDKIVRINEAKKINYHGGLYKDREDKPSKKERDRYHEKIRRETEKRREDEFLKKYDQDDESYIEETVKNCEYKKCPKCGSDEIGVYLQGEPIYKCKNCGEFLGVVPFSSKNEFTNIFTSGDFDEYKEYGERRLQEIQDEENELHLSEGFITQLTMSAPVKAYNVKNKTPINDLYDLIKYHKNPGLIEYVNKCNNIKDLEYIKKDTYTVIPSIKKIKERISLCKELGSTSKTASYYKFIKEKYIDAGITERDCDATIEWVKSFCKSITDKIDKIQNESCVYETKAIDNKSEIDSVVNVFKYKSSKPKKKLYDNLTKFGAYHLEPTLKPRNKIYGGWDEELYSKDIPAAINNDIKYNYQLKGKDKVSAYVYTAGKDLKAIYLGKITIFDKDTGDWEWEEQETLDKKTYDYLIDYPIAESTDINNFYEEDYE